jgi:hypothetical protein
MVECFVVVGVALATRRVVAVRPLMRGSLGVSRAVATTAVAGVTIATFAVAGLVGCAAAGCVRSDEPAWCVTAALASTALRWGSLLAAAAELGLRAVSTCAVVFAAGWLAPRAIPGLAILDPSSVLTSPPSDMITVAGLVADAGAILGFGVAAILLGRRFRPLT